MDCVVCKKPSQNVCSSCKNVAYCSVTCQKLDWKLHKKSCLPFIIKKKEDGTEYFEATRDIKTGTIIFEETPIFQIPLNEKLVTCLSCSIPLQGDKSQKCSVCGWPICSSQCQQLPIHKDNECQFFSSNKIKYSPDVEMDLPLIAAGIRAFTIKKNNLKLWEQLEKLGLEDMKKDKINPSQFGKSIIHHLRKSKEKTELDNALKNGYKLFYLLLRNGFARLLFEYAIVRPDPKTGNYNNPNIPRGRGYYLFVKAGKMAHSCCPNTIWYVSDSPDFKLRLRALVPILKGEELTLSRLAHRPEETRGTIERREFLKKYCGIVCKCARCSSPSEFGSFNSAIKCNFCCVQEEDEEVVSNHQNNPNSGYFLPVDPLIFDSSGQTILLQCNRCSMEIPYSECLPTITEISRQLDFNPRFDPDYPAFSVNDVLDFLNSCEENFLHRNHYLLQRAAYSLTEFLRHHTQDLIVDIKKTKPFSPQLFASCAYEIREGIQKCYYLNEIVEKMMPGFSYAKGRILASLTTFKLQEVNLSSSALFTTDAVADLNQKIRERIQQLDLILSYYKDDLPSHREQKNCDQFIWFKSQRDDLQNQLNKRKLVSVKSSADS